MISRADHLPGAGRIRAWASLIAISFGTVALTTSTSRRAYAGASAARRSGARDTWSVDMQEVARGAGSAREDVARTGGEWGVGVTATASGSFCIPRPDTPHPHSPPKTRYLNLIPFGAIAPGL